LTDEKRRQAAEDEKAILNAAKKQDEYDEVAYLHSYVDEEHAKSGATGRRFSFDGIPYLSSSPERSNPHAHPESTVFDWGRNIIENVKRRISAASIDSVDAGAIRLHSTDSLAEMESVLRVPVLKKVMHHLMSSLDAIVATPFVYLSKGSDPVSLQLAIEYITSNELTSNIIVVHFVDDRKSATLHHKVMRRVSSIVEKGEMEKEEAEKYADNLLKRTFAGGTSMHSEHEHASDDGESNVMFDFEDSASLLSENVQQLVKTVSLLDTFHA
jgi:polyhydroxyalkanoate synthesis regulator phasin